MAVLPGSRLGQYEVLAPLGAGGMGEVYRARDSKLGRDVAIKVLPEEMAADAERLARFEREARALAALNHPGIVTIYAVEQSGQTRYLAMELVEGKSLDKAMEAGGLSISRFFEIAVPLAEALSAAHERGIVHRDLKPANVMITREGRVKVLDFGLARLEAPDSDSNVTGVPTASRVELTGEGQIFGTVAYMSPEQARGGKVDARSDVFSLGIVLYQMLAGARPFQGESPMDLLTSILRDRPASITDLRTDVPPHLARILRRSLEKDPRDRYQTSRDVFNELRDLQAETSAPPTVRLTTAPSDSDAVRAEEGFWIAVLPFKVRGGDPAVESLADGLTEDIVTGLSRFSYLRVVARSSTAQLAGQGLDVRAAGKALGARYVMDGTLRQAGTKLRLAVQLLDAATGAHLWAENYERHFAPESLFELQDDLAPPIVSTIADMHGVLPRSMSEALRSRPPEQLTPYEAVLRGFGYSERPLAEELAAARFALELAVRKAPANADAWAMLALLCVQDYAQGFQLQADSLASGLAAAQRAAELAPSNSLAQSGLAQAHFFRREFESFRIAAERAVALNPLNGDSLAFLGELLIYSGDRERGLALTARAKQLNLNHPGWYWYADFYDAYGRGDDRAALGFALKVNLPGHWFAHAATAAALGQLGERDAAGRALKDLLRLKPAFAATARAEGEKWWKPEYIERLIEGLRRAGLDVPAPPGADPAVNPAVVAIAVLPFEDVSPGRDQEYLCEGMAEEIMNALVRIPGIRVASRTSAFRAGREGKDLPEIARALSVSHVLEGSVRAAGSRLRVTARLTDVESGYQLWSDRFDRDVADVFALQDDIAAGVVEAVEARLAAGERSVRARPQVGNLEAYRHYLMGRHLRYTKNDLAGALKAFEEAVRLDPAHAPSWVALAEARILASFYGLVPAGEAYALAKRPLATATAQQGEAADALYVEALIAFGDRDWAASERALRRAVLLAPEAPPARCWSGILFTLLGRAGEAAPHFRAAREADPLAPYPYAMSALGALLEGRAADAVSLYDQALAFEPESTLALWGAGLARIALARAEEGVAMLEKALTPSHRGGFIHGALGWSLAKAGRAREARQVLAELQARPPSAPAVVSEAWLLSILGETDAAFRLLERAEAERQPALAFVGLPGFDSLREDPRFEALLARLRIPPAKER